MAKYVRSFSSGGKKISTSNEVITFVKKEYENDGYEYNDSLEYKMVEYLSFETFATPCRIRLNDEETVHWIDADSKAVITDMGIYQITILDENVEYHYTAFATK